jgi:methylmalonyl-CoA mutase, C-terminal domain
MSSAGTSNPRGREGRRFTPRVLLCKSFIDSHDRAIGTITKALRDSGMEVILLDYQLAEEIAAAATQEDVDVIGVSFMSGGQVDVTQRLQKALREAGHDDLPVVVGGAIRPFDLPELEQAGVKAVFRGGEPLASMIETFASLARESRAAR